MSARRPGVPGRAHGPERRETPTEFSIVIGRFLGTVVVTVKGTLDTLAATRLAATLHDLIEGQGNLAIAVDLKGLCHLAPSGLQVLSTAASGLERRGGCFSLSEPPDPLLRALDVAGLTRLIHHSRPRPGPRERGDGRGDALRPSGGGRARHPAGTGTRWNRQGGSG